MVIKIQILISGHQGWSYSTVRILLEFSNIICEVENGVDSENITMSVIQSESYYFAHY